MNQTANVSEAVATSRNGGVNGTSRGSGANSVSGSNGVSGAGSLE